MNRFQHFDTNRHPNILIDALTEIARRHLDVDTLEERGKDSLDFHECAVWSLQAALKSSYLLGFEQGFNCLDEPVKTDPSTDGGRY